MKKLLLEMLRHIDEETMVTKKLYDFCKSVSPFRVFLKRIHRHIAKDDPTLTTYLHFPKYF